MKSITSILCATTLVALTNIASAASFIYNDNTNGLATFNRPVGEADYPLTPDQVTLSELATDVEYYSQSFNVSITGAYDFLTSSTDFDTYIVLYNAGGFNPADSTLNVEALNDDGLVAQTSALTGILLQQGVTYTLVTTGFSNDDQGAFTSSITGPGEITAVPEPSSMILVALAGGFIAFTARKRFSKLA